MSQEIPLSESDRKLLRLLQNDLSLSKQELAERVGMSTSTLWRRQTELEELGLIKRRVALVDPDRAGMPICVFVSVNMANHEKKDRIAFERFVADTPEILECYSVTGAHDYMMIVRTGSVADFQTFLMTKILGHPAVATASSQIALGTQKYTTEIPV